MDQSHRKLGQLDALRGIAILGVLLVHSGSTAAFHLNLKPFLVDVILAGQRGVQLFFIVSAFTLALSNERRKHEANAGVNFFLRRFFRLAPMFYVMTVVTRLLRPDLAGTWKQCLFTMTFLHGFSADTINKGVLGGWSVADEAIFYACLPLLLRYLRSIRSTLFVLVAVAIATRPLTGYLLGHSPVQHWEYLSFFSMLDEFPIFLIGLLAYRVWEKFPVNRERSREMSALLLGTALLLGYRLLPFSNHGLIPESISLGLLLLAVVIQPWPVLVNRATIFLGKISFSFYLIHILVLIRLSEKIHSMAPNFVGFSYVVVSFVGGLLITLPLAIAGWYFLEKPGIELGNKLIQRLSGPTADGNASVPKLTSPQDIPGAQF